MGSKAEAWAKQRAHYDRMALIEKAKFQRERADAARALADELGAALRAADHCHVFESRCRECGRWNTEGCEPDPKGTIDAALAKWEKYTNQYGG